MIRIIGPMLLWRSRAPAPVLDLHPFVDNQCCTALSRLQHEAEIPNYAGGRVADFANPHMVTASNALDFSDFRVWHGSCSVLGIQIADWSE
jgi:hypothetical protein